MSLIPKDRAAEYTTTVIKKDGEKTRRVIDNDDAVARMLRGKTHDELEAVAKEHGLHDRWTDWKARGLNAGQISMNFRNSLRKKLKDDAEDKTEATAVKETRAAGKKKAA